MNGRVGRLRRTCSSLALGFHYLRRETAPHGKETSEAPLHAHFTLSSLACVKRGKHLFSLFWLRPPTGERRGWMQSREMSERCIVVGRTLKAASLPVLMITLPVFSTAAAPGGQSRTANLNTSAVLVECFFMTSLH